jgi:hypothetical protein
MSSSTLAIIIACIAGAVSLASAFGVELLRRRGDKVRLALEQDRVREDRELAEKAKSEESDRFISKYRDPLLRSAYDLQSRIYNVYRPDGFKGGKDPDYFRLNTMFLFAEFLAWLEIIRREVQFLDLGAVQGARDLSHALQAVQNQIATTTAHHDYFYLYRGQQRAIGELMLVPRRNQETAGPGYECMGYAAFVAAQEDPAFASWFTRLGEAVDQLPATRPGRLVWVQRALIDLIDLLDPGHHRFEVNRRRLPEPESPQSRPTGK